MPLNATKIKALPRGDQRPHRHR